MRRELEFPVLHTTDFRSGGKKVSSSVALKRGQDAAVLGPIAKAGDIVIARVGRNLHEKVAAVPRGRFAISDCIFLIRPKPGCEERVLGFLQSEPGAEALAAAAHGVGAKFITATALADLQVPQE